MRLIVLCMAAKMILWRNASVPPQNQRSTLINTRVFQIQIGQASLISHSSLTRDPFVDDGDDDSESMADNAQGDREDVPRISVDSLADWERIKASYAEAAMNELEESYVHSIPASLRVEFVFIVVILVKNEEGEERWGE